jgi:hypothetical protein
MYDPKTGGIHETRDVIWLKRMFYEKAEAENDVAIGVNDEDLEMVIGNDDDKNLESIVVGEGDDDKVVQENESDDDDGDGDAVKEANKSTGEADPAPTMTRTGRTIKPPKRLITEIGDVGYDDYEIKLTEAEKCYYATMRDFPQGEFNPGEIACVGAGIGGGFSDTHELHVMKYNEAMATNDRKKWEIAVKEEKKRMDDSGVFQPIPRDKVPKGAKILTSTWAMKKKANGTFRARLNARGYEQVDGEHYDENAKAAPVVNEATIHIVLILAIMADWHAEVVDVKGAFLHGEFEKGRRIYMEVPQGFEEYYPPNTVLLLKKTLYGTKQAAMAFWRKLVDVFIQMKYQRSKADPCLYFSWEDNQLVLWTSWVDDCLIVGKKECVLKAKERFKNHFDCDEVGELKEYVGCKLERNRKEGWMKLTQPVLMQSFIDEFILPDGETPKTPAIPGEVLHRGDPGSEISKSEHQKYRTGVGKLLHVMKWTRPDVLNAVRELSRFVSNPTEAHKKAMLRVMKYCVETPNRGLLLKPNKKWNGNPEFEFVVTGRADSDYAKDPDRRRSVSGYSTFLCGAPVTMKSRMQGCVTLSVTEAELVSATQCAQDMLFIMRILESIGLKVQKPMVLEIDNKGAVDLAHNWSIGGRTRHDSVRQNFLRELEEQEIVTVKWIPTSENSADLFTKNLPGPLFNKHVSVYCGHDEYMEQVEREGHKYKSDSQGEGVRSEPVESRTGRLSGTK